IISNIIFYSVYLRKMIEANLYRSHPSLSNLNEILSNNVIHFNIILAGIIFVLMTAVYLILISRIRRFFKILQNNIKIGTQTGTKNLISADMPVEFSEFNSVFRNFLEESARRQMREKQSITKIKEQLMRGVVDSS
ncbi:MAG: hypothetical protein MUP70_12850, partial [Candidatus Aminicenantes bacterium]|nr:hypothetical protein [Candidatus Aminicenantes bacterium]